MALELLYGSLDCGCCGADMLGWFGLLKSGTTFSVIQQTLGAQELRRFRLAVVEEEGFDQKVRFRTKKVLIMP